MSSCGRGEMRLVVFGECALCQAREVSRRGRRADLLFVCDIRYLNDQVARYEQQKTPYTLQGQWPVQLPSSSSSSSSSQPHPAWPSPAYPQLRGNVLPRFLSFSMAPPFPAPANQDPFPTLAETEEYLLKFTESQGLRKRIKTGREVLGAWEMPPSDSSNGAKQSGGWLVLARQWPPLSSASSSTPTLHIQHFSHLCLSSGWYDFPIYTPFIPGFSEAQSKGFVHHAKWYRGPEAYRDKRAVVVGNGNSANDIAAHIAGLYPASASQQGQKAGPKVWRSIRHKALPIFVSLPDERIKDVAPIKRYTVRPAGDGVDIELEDGTLLEKIDVVILGTGYDGSKYPFVHLLNRSPSESEAQRVRKHADKLLSEGVDQEFQVRFIGQQQLRGRERDLQVSLWSRALSFEAKSLWSPMDSTSLPTLPESDTQNTHIADRPAAPLSSTSALPATSASSRPEWTPTRVGGLHKHCLLARNPSLACVGLVVSYTPFISTDVYSWYVRSVWDGSVSLPHSWEERLRDETERIEKLRAIKRDIVPLEKATLEQWRKDGFSQPPPEHLPSGFLAYHVFGQQEAAWHRHLRQEVVKAKPWLDDHLDDWSQAEHEKIRMGMYAQKYDSLVKKRQREAQQTQKEVQFNTHL